MSKKEGIFLIILFCCFAAFIAFLYMNKQKNNEYYPIVQDAEILSEVLPRVESFEKLKELVETSETVYGDAIAQSAEILEATDSVAYNGGQRNSDYSTTNVQVSGVDEADIVKTDGEYIYYVTSNKIVIVDAQNPNSLNIVSELKYDNDEEISVTLQELYINKNRLIVIANKYANSNQYAPELYSDDMSRYAMPYTLGSTYAVAMCYDVTDKSNVTHLRDIEVEGYYTSSRMINDDVYIISNKSIYLNDQIDPRPLYRDTLKGSEDIVIDYNEMYYFPDSECNNYLLIAGFNINSNREVDIQTYLGAGNTVYSSEENMYIAMVKYNYPISTEEKVTIDMFEGYEVNTEIYKFNLQQGSTKFQCYTTIPGSILNQFSMDENNGYFRIATNNNDGWSSENSVNNLYILDENLNITGTVEGLAKGERIYSVRFMGDRAYIVTFKQVDPLFVIDISNPNNPEVLGELKIPGFSEYLHPYSDNLLIGIGQDTETINEYYGERTITIGMKMAMFDVSDANNPKELFSTKIGGMGTYSEILNNHKSLLFSKEKDILSFPITVTERNATDVMQYGRLEFQGAIVYGVDLEKGFIEKGRISHVNIVDNQSYFSYDYNKKIDRIIYIGNTLFTISRELIKSIDMNTLEELSSIEITIDSIYADIMPY